MIDTRLPDEVEELRLTVRRFAREVVAPTIGPLYQAEQFPYEIIAEMGRLGLFGLPFPEEYGGMGGDYLALCVALEELGRVDSSVAITLEAAVCLGAMPLYRYGTEQQRQEWLPRLTSGVALGAFGLTEPGGGTDAAATRTAARRDGDSWVVDGSKAFITNSGTDITAFVMVAARTSPGPGGSGISTILVPSGTPGLEVSPPYSKVGWSSSNTCGLSFDDCRVPLDNLVGQEGRGYAQFIETLDEGRVALAALSVGLAQGCVDESLRYAADREAFGRPIGANQSVAFMIADMELRAHTARVSYYDAVSRMLRGEPFKREAAVAKLYASQAAVANARDATQVFGGAGFLNETAVGRMWRDAKVLEIGEGTNEVQRMVVARDLGVGSRREHPR